LNLGLDPDPPRPDLNRQERPMPEIDARITALPDKSLLLLDDDQALRTRMGRALEARGFEVTTAYTGEEVVFLLEDHTYEVAFVDAKLPDIDGMQLASEMATLDARPAVEKFFTRDNRATVDAIRRVQAQH